MSEVDDGDQAILAHFNIILKLTGLVIVIQIVFANKLSLSRVLLFILQINPENTLT